MDQFCLYVALVACVASGALTAWAGIRLVVVLFFGAWEAFLSLCLGKGD